MLITIVLIVMDVLWVYLGCVLDWVLELEPLKNFEARDARVLTVPKLATNLRPPVDVTRGLYKIV